MIANASLVHNIAGLHHNGAGVVLVRPIIIGIDYYL
ncbi:hypothetical protein AN394_00773 [Pseudoalteromonas sp. P1-26]|nr:hypothetical protein AN394_00773 [Pseudoalteromonas sp. P1-26]